MKVKIPFKTILTVPNTYIHGAATILRNGCAIEYQSSLFVSACGLIDSNAVSNRRVNNYSKRLI